MDRRIALKNLGILTGGIVLLPSCNFSQDKVSFSLNKLSISESQEALMKSIVKCIIPEGEIPGAASLNIDGFVWVMVDDCLSKERQSTYLSGLDGFNEYVANSSGKEFVEMNQSDQEESLLNILKVEKGNADETLKNIQFFVSHTKRLTAWGYMQSEYIMKEIMPYTLVPGTYGPCETIDNSKRINVNG